MQCGCGVGTWAPEVRSCFVVVMGGEAEEEKEKGPERERVERCSLAPVLRDCMAVWIRAGGHAE